MCIKHVYDITNYYHLQLTLRKQNVRLQPAHQKNICSRGFLFFIFIVTPCFFTILSRIIYTHPYLRTYILCEKNEKAIVVCLKRQLKRDLYVRAVKIKLGILCL